jgi:hypothetical protein
LNHIKELRYFRYIQGERRRIGFPYLKRGRSDNEENTPMIHVNNEDLTPFILTYPEIAGSKEE